MCRQDKDLHRAFTGMLPDDERAWVAARAEWTTRARWAAAAAGVSDVDAYINATSSDGVGAYAAATGDTASSSEMQAVEAERDEAILSLRETEALLISSQASESALKAQLAALDHGTGGGDAQGGASGAGAASAAAAAVAAASAAAVRHLPISLMRQSDPKL